MEVAKIAIETLPDLETLVGTVGATMQTEGPAGFSTDIILILATVVEEAPVAQMFGLF